MYDVAIIGAGVIGAAIARELSRYDIAIAVLDKESEASTGTSKANSGIIHAGYDPEENTLMATLNVRGNPMFDTLCEELSVPFKRNGSLVVAFDDEQVAHILKLKRQGSSYGISGMSILSGHELLKKEPAINPKAKAALYSESAGVIDPMLLTISLLENAVMNGAECFFDFNVGSIEKENGAYKIISNDNSVMANYVVNAAGVFADSIHNMVAEPSFAIEPVRGQYFLLDISENSLISSTIFPCPSKEGKGVLISPSVYGNLILGPSSERVSDGADVATTTDMLNKVREGVSLLVPGITTGNNIRTFAGVRAVSDTGDFIIGEARRAPGFIDVAGIKSPGLSAAPAIAKYVISIIREKGLVLNEKTSFDPKVKRKLFIDMEEEEQVALIKETPLYGRIICRCENITEGDIVDTIKRPAGATTVGGVKRRCRAGSGRCQSGFCGPKVQGILARELKMPLEKITLENLSSYILTGRTKGG